MRLLLMVLASAAGLSAQVELADPEYVIPKENPFAAPDDVKRGEQLFMGQCAGSWAKRGGRQGRCSGAASVATRRR